MNKRDEYVVYIKENGRKTVGIVGENNIEIVDEQLRVGCFTPTDWNFALDVKLFPNQ
jgi:hypothetical protein